MMNQTTEMSARCPADEASRQSPASLSLAERRARALAPTIFCPSGQVDQCLRQFSPAGATP